MEEEVAAVEDDEVVHKGPDIKGRVLWVMSHSVLKRDDVCVCMCVRERDVEVKQVASVSFKFPWISAIELN